MLNFLRSTFAVVIGFIAAACVMMTVESINGKILYPELGKQAEGVTDREQIIKIMAEAPLGALIVVLVGWAVGSTVGGILTTLTSGSRGWREPLILGVLLTLGGIANNLMIPPPAWFWIATLVALFPFAILGRRCVVAPAAVPSESK